MTWIDNNGEVRPQSWEEYCEIESLTRCLPYWMTGAGFNYRPQPLHPVRAKTEIREKVLRIRQRLFRADPHCFWCGCLTRMGAINGPTQTTVDHLYSRLHPERAERHREQKGVLHVLACAACNNERGIREQQGRPFIPKLKERLEFAQLADATLALKDGSTLRAQAPDIVRVRALKEEFLEEARPVLPMRVIQTLEEAIKFARENPAR